MKNTLAVAGAIASAGATVAAPRAAAAHFQELIPSEDILTQQTGPTVTLEAVFTHPFENGPVMDMGAPVQFGVLAGGVKRDLRPAFQAFKVDGKQATAPRTRSPRRATASFSSSPRPTGSRPKGS